MTRNVDQGSLFGYISPVTGDVSSHPPLCACGRCSMPVETFGGFLNPTDSPDYVTHEDRFDPPTNAQDT